MPFCNRLPGWLLFCCVLVGSARSSAAQTAYNPLEAADTTSPKNTLSSFLDGCKEVYDAITSKRVAEASDAELRAVTDRITKCLDLTDVPPTVRDNVSKEAAVLLKEVLDRVELPSRIGWPSADEMAESESDVWTIPGTQLRIAKVAVGPRAGEYLFTPATVHQSQKYYELVADLPYKRHEWSTPRFLDWYLSQAGWMIPRSLLQRLPDWAVKRWYGQAVWQWIALFIVLFLAALAMVFTYIIGRQRAVRFRFQITRYIISISFLLAAMFIPLFTRFFLVDQVRISGQLSIYLTFTLNLIFLAALIVVLMGAGNRIAEVIIAARWAQPQTLDAQLVRLLCRILSIVGAAVVFLEGGRQMGIPLTTLLAGAGVGGLTLALAAQDTLKNVFGSMMVILDKPFRVGERIVVKGYDGTVEEIGLRSTRLRLLNGHQVTIPNEEMARSDIENIGRRPFIRRTAKIAIPYGTPIQKVHQAVEIVREILQDHEGMHEDFPPRVYLRDLERDALVIFLIYWYHPPEYWNFLHFSERVNLEIMSRFEAHGIRVALPESTIHMHTEGTGNETHAPVDQLPSDALRRRRQAPSEPPPRSSDDEPTEDEATEDEATEDE